MTMRGQDTPATQRNALHTDQLSSCPDPPEHTVRLLRACSRACPYAPYGVSVAACKYSGLRHVGSLHLD
jgi:hypothetical protein